MEIKDIIRGKHSEKKLPWKRNGKNERSKKEKKRGTEEGSRQWKTMDRIFKAAVGIAVVACAAAAWMIVPEIHPMASTLIARSLTEQQYNNYISGKMDVKVDASVKAEDGTYAGMVIENHMDKVVLSGGKADITGAVDINYAGLAENKDRYRIYGDDSTQTMYLYFKDEDEIPVMGVTDKDYSKWYNTNALVDEYYDKYEILLEGRDPEEFKKHVAVQAQIELGFERFLQEKNYQAIVTHFGDLGALKQLPGLAIQRLMEKGYGFGAEGDWKVAAMVRLMKVMTAGMKDAKGTSMLEDYTYNLVKGKEGILEAHMLEICPSIADGPISIKCQPLSMGDREDPARLVFTSKEGHGIATSLIDLGNRFRLIINDVECKKTEKPMPKLPTATNFWTPEPDIYTGAEAWILAGGAHHTAFTYDLTAEQMGDWAAAMGIEAVYIDKDTKIRDFKRDLMLGEVFYR